MNEDMGVALSSERRSAAPSGLSPCGSQAEPAVTNAWFSPTIYLSCPICFGSREAFGEQCRRCADPEPALARKVLERLRSGQVRFLRSFGHTLSYQPVTAAEWDEFRLCDFYIEDDDGVNDPNDYAWRIPPTRHWFAGSQVSMRYGSLATYVHYNPLGLMLRECLMAGADAALAAPASALEARRGETGTGSIGEADDIATLAEGGAR